MMNPFVLAVPGLVAVEAVLVVLRLRNVIAWRWWMMAPLGLGTAIFLAEATAALMAVTVARRLLDRLLG
jgi:hypothetical protein